MPVFIPFVIAAAVGAGSSIAFGYATEKTVGDKEYTARDAAIDGLLGAAGFSAIKGAKSGYQAVKYANYARKARNARRPIPIQHRLYGESFAKYDAEVFQYVAMRHGLRSAKHTAPLAVGSYLKINNTRANKPTTVNLGGRKITILDPVTQDAFDDLAQTGGQSSQPTEVNRTTRQTSRSAKSTRKSGGRAPTWCKIHKRYDYC